MSVARSGVGVPLRRLSVLSFVWLALVAAPAVSLSQNPPASHFKPGVPDLDQRTATDPFFNGNNHCTPTAAANSLTWFDQQYGLDVVPDGFSSVDLIDTMAAHFNTNDPDGDGSSWTGSFTDDVVKGFRDFLNPFGPYNNSGLFWDVKFQGSTFNRGYTVGQVAAAPSLNWIKNELATDEDVLLNVLWYEETSPGVLTRLRGAHTITLDGYTSGGANSDLLIRDPWYAEGIIERDTSYPDRLVYEYSTDPNTPNLRAEIVEAVSVSPKEFLLFDGLVLPDEYIELPPPSCFDCLYYTDYIDNLSLGIDLPQLPQPLGPDDFGSVQIVDPDAGKILEIQFNGDGLLAALLIENDFVTSVDPFVNLLMGFGPSQAQPTEHGQLEVFLNKDALGDFQVDSFFDIAYQIEFQAAPGINGHLGTIPLPAQQVSIDPDPTLPTIPDFDRDGGFDVYPNPDPPPIDAIDLPEILGEQIARLIAEVGLFGGLAGDFNGDGVVDAADYTVWRDEAAGLLPSTLSDANFDGAIDEFDRLVWAANYGAVADFLPVPEPNAAAVALALLASGAATRRRARG